MATDPFLDDSSRVVTLEAFDFIFRNELKRAVRAQNFLTLLRLETSPVAKSDRPSVIRQLARLVGGDVRETDLVAEGESGRVWVLLLDTDLRNSMSVVDRLLARFRHYEFSTPIGIDIGAACCPTHGTDVESFKRAADVREGREGSGTPLSHAQGALCVASRRHTSVRTRGFRARTPPGSEPWRRATLGTRNP